MWMFLQAVEETRQKAEDRDTEEPTGKSKCLCWQHVTSSCIVKKKRTLYQTIQQVEWAF